MLLFGSETWVVNPHMDKDIVGFRYQSIRSMAGMCPKRQQYGTWVYLPIGLVLAAVGLDYIGVYIARRHKTVAQYISICTIMNLCLVAEQRLWLA